MGGATAYLQKNFLTVVAAVAVVAVVVLVGIYLGQSRARSRQEASQMLYRAGSLISNGSFSEAILALDDLIARHGASPQGKAAHFLSGSCHLALSENDIALESFRRYLQVDPHGPYAASAQAGIALALEGQGQFAQAADEFRKVLATVSQDDPLYAQSVLGVARCLDKQGQTAAAIEALKPLAEAANNPARQDAESRIAVYRARMETPSS
jgi:tetratricopeptide (TPR) repeat protein